MASFSSAIAIANAPRRRRAEPHQFAGIFARMGARSQLIDDDFGEPSEVRVSRAPDGSPFIECMELYRANSGDRWPDENHPDYDYQWRSPPKAKKKPQQQRDAGRYVPPAPQPSFTDEEWDRAGKIAKVRGLAMRLHEIGLWPEVGTEVLALSDKIEITVAHDCGCPNLVLERAYDCDAFELAMEINVWASNAASAALLHKLGQS